MHGLGPDDDEWVSACQLKMHKGGLPLLGSDACGDVETVLTAGAPDCKTLRGRRACAIRKHAF